MELKCFNYHLPETLIAQHPLEKRDAARLMIVDRKTRKIHHDIFSNVDVYLPEKNLLVINNSKVVPARLLGKKQRTGGQVEVFLLNKLSDGYSYEVLLRPVRRLKFNDRVVFGNNGFYAEIIDKNKVKFNKKDISKELQKIGHVPLPPYIKRKDDALDRKYYQTVYARHSGSVAAPTAGLHFTRSLLGKLKKKGHNIKEITLHINYATFKPVEEENIRNHKMHSEAYSISKETLKSIKRYKSQNRKIGAVGTTSCRVLETVAATKKLKGETDLFIYPGYKFCTVDFLLTNFHLPFSTLLMLVSAFGGYSLIMRSYSEAIKKKYRFYSYGDAMLIL